MCGRTGAVVRWSKTARRVPIAASVVRSGFCHLQYIES